MTEAELAALIVKPPIWDKGNSYGGASAWLSFNEKGRFCYGVDLAGLFYMQTPDEEKDGFPSLAAAQSAAEADYCARIAASLDLGPIMRLVDDMTRIADGNLGDNPWQANYARIKQVATDALTALKEASHDKR